jgi:HEAT repeat protein
MVAGLLVATWGCTGTADSTLDSHETPSDRRARSRASTWARAEWTPTEAATAALKAGVQYPHNPVVRAEAVEALEATGKVEMLPWIRTALLDPHPGVRFAACAALGTLRDSGGEVGVRKCLTDADPNVQAAAVYAVHRLGDEGNTSRLATFLLTHDQVVVRRHAALLIGKLGEPSGIKLLARAMNDPDVGVRHHALEAMARLGNPEARQSLVFLCNSGVGSDEVFAINALAELRDPMYEDTFRYKLETSQHLETRLAAARSLGLLGFDDGFRLAMQSLRTSKAGTQDPKDPPEGQILRTRQLAAAALGAVGRRDAVPAMEEVLRESTDPRLQISVAKGILEIEARSLK